MNDAERTPTPAPGPNPTPGAEPLPMVRVVVLNWNAAALTARCIDSLLATDWPADRLRIVVVDNASIDGSIERLERWFAHTNVEFRRNALNLGFAEGCNSAMRDLDGVDLVALVNNDATVDTAWLRELWAVLGATPGAGAAVPRMLFDAPYVTLRVQGGSPLDGASHAELVTVTSDDIDVSGRTLLGDGTWAQAHTTRPLVHRRWFTGEIAEIHVPVPEGRPSRVGVGIATTTPVTVTTPDGASVTAGPVDEVAWVQLVVTGGIRRINSLGTELTESFEGIERHFGEADRATLPGGTVTGFSGGGVLLRRELLERAGRFDPRLFAYYEDTDLSWRARRAGFSVVAAPQAVLWHAHGGTAGSNARGFMLLNYRNWLVTVVRNGSGADIRSAVRLARHFAWAPTRGNVLARLKHGQVPDAQLSLAWARVFAATAAAAPRALRTRSLGSAAGLGAEPVTRVRSRFQARPHPRPPVTRPGGHTVVYVDVTSTLESPWRAGIQRLVVELVDRLPRVAPDLDVVALRWSRADGAFRRLTPAEWNELFDGPATVRPVRPPSRGVRRIARGVARRAGAGRLQHAWERRRRPAEIGDLLLDGFAPGSWFLDPDASWNVVECPRTRLIGQLHQSDVRMAWFAHDLFPMEHPEWFDRGLVRVFGAHARAHVDHGDLVITNSQATAASVRALLSGRGRATTLPVVPVPLAAEPRASRPPSTTGQALLDGLGDRPFLLTVGTVEPRKNQGTVIDAWEQLRRRHPGLRLVIAGKPGWRADDLVARIRGHQDLGDGLLWTEGVDEGTLDELYRRSAAVVVASWTEGFGLPVIEALQKGARVVSSSGGALPEAVEAGSGGWVRLVDPADLQGFITAIDAALSTPTPPGNAAAAPRGGRRWNDVATEVAALLTPPGI